MHMSRQFALKGWKVVLMSQLLSSATQSDMSQLESPMSTQLSPCPFCGEQKAEIDHCEEECCGAKPRWIRCPCGCELGGLWKNDEEAVSAWNTRITKVTFLPTTSLPFIQQGCVSSRYCPTCEVNLHSSCMCLFKTCGKCKSTLSDDIDNTKPYRLSYKWGTEE